MNQVGHGFAMDANKLLLEADAFVLFQYRGTALANDAIAFTNGGRYMANLEATGFAGAHLAAEVLEGLGEKGRG